MCNLQLQASLVYGVFRTRVETAVLLCSPGCKGLSTIWAKAVATPLSGKGLIHFLCYHKLLLSNWDRCFNSWQLSWLAWQCALPCLQSFALSHDKSKTSHIWHQEARSLYQKETSLHLGKVRKTTVLMKLNSILHEKINSDEMQKAVWFFFSVPFFLYVRFLFKKKGGGACTQKENQEITWSDDPVGHLVNVTAPKNHT